MKMTFGVTNGALASILPQKLIIPSFVIFRYGEVINSFGKFSISPNTKCSFGFYSSTRSILKRKNIHLDCYNCVLCSNHVEENLNLPSNYSIMEIMILIKDPGDRCLGVVPV
jgi:hypothetical protein